MTLTSLGQILWVDPVYDLSSAILRLALGWNVSITFCNGFKLWAVNCEKKSYEYWQFEDAWKKSHFWGGSWNVSHHFKTAHTCKKDWHPQARWALKVKALHGLPPGTFTEDHLFLSISIISKIVACLWRAFWLLPSSIALKSVITRDHSALPRTVLFLTVKYLHPGANLSPEQVSAVYHWLQLCSLALLPILGYTKICYFCLPNGTHIDTLKAHSSCSMT